MLSFYLFLSCLQWLVVEARNLSSTIKGVCQESFTDEETQLVKDLDAFGYDEGAKYVYGIEYAEWKAEHAKKATDKQLSMYKASATIHAKHDKKMLEPQCKQGPASYAAPSDEPERRSPTFATQVLRKVSLPTAAAKRPTSRSAPRSKKPPPLSDVCCEDVDNDHSMDRDVAVSRYRTPSPPKVDLFLRVGILTISDRAANGEYENGDLSGPAVEQSLNENITKLNAMRGELDATNAKIIFCVKSIVPDEFEDIVNHLHQWCGKDDEGPTCDIIFTTGGTGFSARDITPEATNEVIEKDASGLMTFATAQCSAIQPLAALSRGVAGICGGTLIVNLPGNPAGVGQVLDILVPLLLHAIKDIKGL
jgi:gephyrin